MHVGANVERRFLFIGFLLFVAVNVSRHHDLHREARLRFAPLVCGDDLDAHVPAVGHVGEGVVAVGRTGVALDAGRTRKGLKTPSKSIRGSCRFRRKRRAERGGRTRRECFSSVATGFLFPSGIGMTKPLPKKFVNRRMQKCCRCGASGFFAVFTSRLRSRNWRGDTCNGESVIMQVPLAVFGNAMSGGVRNSAQRIN